MSWARLYFAVQAVAGAAWWVVVFTIPFVREVTLGSLDPVAVATVDIPLFVVASALAAADRAGRLGRLAAVIATAWTAVVALGLAVYATVMTEAGWGVLIMAAATGGSLVALALVLLGRIPTQWIIAGPFAFRPLRPDLSIGATIALTIVQMVVFWGLFLGAAPLVLRVLELRWRVDAPLPPVVAVAIAVLGVVLFVLASALGIWSAIVMAFLGRGTPLPTAMASSLVVAGPYRFVRNPMAVAGITQGVAIGLALGSWVVVAYAVTGSLIWNYAVRPHEEADLESRFGDEFRRYRAEVRCWLPRPL